MSDPGTTPFTLACDPDQEPTRRERAAALFEQRLDIPMAVLAVVWAGLVAYELVAPARQRDVLALVGNVVWLVFVVEFLGKLWISGNPVRFLRRRWPSVVFLVLPALRVVRVVRALRIVRLLPAARVMGSSYRAIGTARSLLGGRLVSLVVISAVVVFSGGQLLFLTERMANGRPPPLGDALWWSANLALTGTLVFEPESLLSRLVSVVLGVYAVVVFASVAAALGAFLIESRAERAAAEEET